MPYQICQYNTNPRPILGKSPSNVSPRPTRHQSTKPLPIPDQSTNLSPIYDQSTSPIPTHQADESCITNNPPNCKNRQHSNHPHWHSIGNGPANNRPIRVTNPHLVKGTSTIRCQLLSGPHHSRATVRCCHNVNARTIKCQSITSMMPFMCQSIAIPVLVNCQSISNANTQPICHSNAYPKLICQSANLKPIFQSNATWTISQSPNAPSTHLSAPTINTGF